MKHLFTLSVFILIALTYWGLQTYEQKKTFKTDGTTDQPFIDIFMRDFKLTTMNEQGKPDLTLQASSMEHYHGSKQSVITDPVIELLEENSRWSIRASKGEINDGKNRIELTEDVIMVQLDTLQPVELRTQQLIIDTRKQIAESSQQVHIKQHQLELTSKGMVLNNRTGKLKLLASVEGRYEAIN